MKPTKKKIAVIFGGCSSEYLISLQSAGAVLANLDKTRYTPVMIGITVTGEWRLYDGEIERIAADTWHESTFCTPVAILPDRTGPRLLRLGRTMIEEIKIDAAFPIIHGRNGEDGTIQGLFELMGIPLVGCGVLASALCMDKDRAHRLVAAAGIVVPDSLVMEDGAEIRDGADMERALVWAETIGYPLFVKPVRAGSSYGISRVTGSGELAAAIKRAFTYDNRIIIEEGIDGFEVGCAVMGNNVLTMGAADEIELVGGFFDYTEKYTLETAAIHVPARIAPAVAEQIKACAAIIYRTLGCRGLARVDMFLSVSGAIVFNEVNTIPGFTAHSRFPQMFEAVGVSFPQIITAAIELSFEPTAAAAPSATALPAAAATSPAAAAPPPAGSKAQGCAALAGATG